MTIHFTKTQSGEIEVSILKDGKIESFSYIKMIESLMNGLELECSFSEQFDSEEKNKINNLKKEINEIVRKEKEALDS